MSCAITPEYFCSWDLGKEMYKSWTSLVFSEFSIDCVPFFSCSLLHHLHVRVPAINIHRIELINLHN